MQFRCRFFMHTTECRRMKGNRAAREQLDASGQKTRGRRAGRTSRISANAGWGGDPSEVVTHAAGGGYRKTGIRTFIDGGISGWTGGKNSRMPYRCWMRKAGHGERLGRRSTSRN